MKKIMSLMVAAALMFSSLGTVSATAATAASQQSVTAQQKKLIEVGKTQLGVPWKYGTMKPGVGFDCSNFTAWVYNKALGIKFSSSSRQQRYTTSLGTPVPIDKHNKFKNLKVGDLLFFANSADAGGGAHVGLYAGEINGKHYVLQEGGGRGKVTFEPMEGTWFASKLVYAKRILHS
ncbi:C40 family peptidase [Paenibacillus sp. OAS669]|uniref:C40 family peptidase n=1 Tax=Paenibacillus sp. OAS669 TaxID=2663821 RepID=UPI001789D478|nr:C40 family peptidase [Paenibacillus sp. OAS669]MBE1446835.1 cell wall-associated NlpC family hydrolase [Paenibacillus sp. OAS669]